MSTSANKATDCNNVSVDKIKRLINSLDILVDEERTSPDVYACPCCNSMVVEGKYNKSNVSMENFPHKKDCPYVEVVEALSNG